MPLSATVDRIEDGGFAVLEIGDQALIVSLTEPPVGLSDGDTVIVRFTAPTETQDVAPHDFMSQCRSKLTLIKHNLTCASVER